MSKAQLKKAIKEMPAEELRELILEAYDSRKEIKEYFEYWLNPDEKELTEATILAIHKHFFKSNNKPNRSFKKSEINKLIKEFKALCYSPELIGRVMFAYANNYAAWCYVKSRGHSHKEAVEKIFTEAKEYAEEHDILSNFERSIKATKGLIEESWWY